MTEKIGLFYNRLQLNPKTTYGNSSDPFRFSDQDIVFAKIQMKLMKHFGLVAIQRVSSENYYCYNVFTTKNVILDDIKDLDGYGSDATIDSDIIKEFRPITKDDKKLYIETSDENINLWSITFYDINKQAYFELFFDKFENFINLQTEMEITGKFFCGMYVKFSENVAFTKQKEFLASLLEMEEIAEIHQIIKNKIN